MQKHHYGSYMRYIPLSELIKRRKLLFVPTDNVWVLQLPCNTCADIKTQLYIHHQLRNKLFMIIRRNSHKQNIITATFIFIYIVSYLIEKKRNDAKV
jgi:hypothetical protein